jgi:hypothetical protein
MDKKLTRFLFRLMVVFFVGIFGMGFFSESLKPILLPNVNVAIIGNTGIKRMVKQTGRIEPLKTETLRCLQTVEILEVIAKKGISVQAGDPLIRVRVRAMSKDQDQAGQVFDQTENLRDQLEELELQANQGGNRAEQAWNDFSEQEEQMQVFSSLYELGVIGKQEWQEWNRQRDELESLWKQAIVSQTDLTEWNREEASMIQGKIQQLTGELIDMQEQCSIEIDENGWIASPVSGIVMEVAEIDSQVKPLDSIMKVAEVTDYKSVKLVTEISMSDYQWVGDTLLVHIRTPFGLLKTYTDNIYQTDHETVVFESIFNKAFAQEIRVGQTYGTIIERQQRFMATVTIPKSLIFAPGGFYDRGMGTVKIIRQEYGILGDEFFIQEVPIRMVVVGDERVITLPLQGFVALNADHLESGTKVYINQ